MGALPAQRPGIPAAVAIRLPSKRDPEARTISAGVAYLSSLARPEWPPIAYRADMVTRILTDFDVPFVTFDQFGSLIDVSPSAEKLVDPMTRAKLGLICQGIVRQMLAVRGASDIRVAAADGAINSAVVESLSISIHSLSVGDGNCVAVGVLAAASRAPSDVDVLSMLTVREREVAQLLASGASTKSIAHALGRSIHTVRRHTDRIFAKTGVGTRTQLACKLLGSARAS
jgi:DNA-binding CsgD family transcriptional regulator